MLIVVAIIAILIAISIPMVSNVLESSRVATDEANERSAKAAALLLYMTFDPDDPTTDMKDEYKALTTTGAAFDAVNGTLVTSADSANIKAYGKCQRQDHPAFGSTSGSAKNCGGHGGTSSDDARILYVMVPLDTTKYAPEEIGQVFGAWGPKGSQPGGSGSPSETFACHILPYFPDGTI